jgi:ATP-dependent Lon protease
MDVHVHVSRASSQRDTASVGLAVLVSLASMLTKIRVRPEVGMTGEISLRGHILAVNGIKEKFLAAHRAGLTEIILPERNRPDLDEVPEKVRAQLKVHFVSKVEDVIPIVLDMKSAMSEPMQAQV